ncbi:hypothetical protein MNBD_NITROSPINAE04-89, partial [hydrothermal vent metagenome]
GVAGVEAKKPIDTPDQARSEPAPELEPELKPEPELAPKPELEPEPEPELKPELTGDVEEPSGGGGESEPGSPGSPENVMLEEVEAAQEQSGQSP